MSDPRLHPCFLGPHGENDSLLEKLTSSFCATMSSGGAMSIRRIHPVNPTHAAQQPAFMAFGARLRGDLHTLSATLNRSMPFHIPRHLGHMVSDRTLPGLAARILTLPYNSNNDCVDAAPVTIELEIRAGLQLARAGLQ